MFSSARARRNEYARACDQEVALKTRKISFPMASQNYQQERPPVNIEAESWLVFGAFYAFVFSIPLQSVAFGFGTLASLAGYLFIATTSLRPRLCYRNPNRIVWCFAAYLVIFYLSGIARRPGLLLADYSFSDLTSELATMIQLLFLFWVSSNLLTQGNRIVRRALFAFATSSIVLAVIQLAGYMNDAPSAQFQDARSTAFGANPNLIGSLLMLGLLALIGLAYGQEETSLQTRAFCLCFAAVPFVAMIRSGSRGSMIAFVVGLCVLTFKRARLGFRVKLAVMIGLALAFVVIASYRIEEVRVRWEAAIFEGDTAGRDEIYTEAAEMFFEKPFLGWGPINHQVELGNRLGLAHARDFHNLYLHLLTEVGVIGAFPFFLGVLLCCASAWRARKSVQRILPLAMLTSVLVLNLKGTSIDDKSLWFVFSYAAASGRYSLLSIRDTRRSLAALRPTTVLLSPSFAGNARRAK